jgi:hypothetical protein
MGLILIASSLMRARRDPCDGCQPPLPAAKIRRNAHPGFVRSFQDDLF